LKNVKILEKVKKYNINNLKEKPKIYLNNEEINWLEYDKVLIFDKMPFLQYYFSLIKFLFFNS